MSNNANKAAQKGLQTSKIKLLSLDVVLGIKIFKKNSTFC